jgi:ABC-2 type transport system ATP-binding protein
MLRIKNFTKQYNGITALQISELEIPGGIHWVKGKNGAGKSTLFRSLAGILPFEGEVWLDDTYEINRDKTAYRLRVNQADAEPVFPPFLHAAEMIDFIAKAKKASQGQVDELKDLLVIRSFENRSIQTYSSGMLKKVSLVMAFLGQPRWIFLDEPLITLDAEATGHLLGLITRSAKSGVNFLISSHEESLEKKIPVDSQYLIENQTLRLCQ